MSESHAMRAVALPPWSGWSGLRSIPLATKPRQNLHFLDSWKSCDLWLVLYSNGIGRDAIRGLMAYGGKLTLAWRQLHLPLYPSDGDALNEYPLR